MGATFSDRPSATVPRYVFSPAVTLPNIGVKLVKLPLVVRDVFLEGIQPRLKCLQALDRAFFPRHLSPTHSFLVDHSNQLVGTRVAFVRPRYPK